jgi:hypothetical protein
VSNVIGSRPISRRMGKIKVEIEVWMQNVDKGRIETTLIFYIFLAFLHAFSNAIYSRPII